MKGRWYLVRGRGGLLPIWEAVRATSQFLGLYLNIQYLLALGLEASDD